MGQKYYKELIHRMSEKFRKFFEARENHARLCELKARIISLQESLDPVEAAELVSIANNKHDHETFMAVQDLSELAQGLISNKVLNSN